MKKFHTTKKKERFITDKLVVKIGSSTITRDGNPLNLDFVDNITSQVSRLFKSGVEVAIVSSGAVACGKKIFPDIGNSTLGNQVAAVYGQAELMTQWRLALAKYGVHAGQVLLTDQDLTKNDPVLHGSLERGVVIINANDPVNDAEMRQLSLSADNDRLAGHIARSINADTLILLTDVDGVLDQNGDLLTDVNEVEEIKQFIQNTGTGTGGMWSKCSVASQAANEGRRTFIINGRERDAIVRVAKGEHIGTRFT